MDVEVGVTVLCVKIYKKVNMNNTNTSHDNLDGSRKCIPPHTHTKANKCLHLDSNSRQAPF